MHLHTVCGILLIVPTVYRDFALAAPVLVQEKHQAYADSAEIAPVRSIVIPYPIIVLAKRGISEKEGVGGSQMQNSTTLHSIRPTVNELALPFQLALRLERTIPFFPPLSP